MHSGLLQTQENKRTLDLGINEIISYKRKVHSIHTANMLFSQLIFFYTTCGEIETSWPILVAIFSFSPAAGKVLSLTVFVIYLYCMYICVLVCAKDVSK